MNHADNRELKHGQNGENDRKRKKTKITKNQWFFGTQEITK